MSSPVTGRRAVSRPIRKGMERSHELLTVKEVALRLRCGRSSVYELMATAKLPFVEFPFGRRVETEALNEFIAGHRIGARTSPRRWGG